MSNRCSIIVEVSSRRHLAADQSRPPKAVASLECPTRTPPAYMRRDRRRANRRGLILSSRVAPHGPASQDTNKLWSVQRLAEKHSGLAQCRGKLDPRRYLSVRRHLNCLGAILNCENPTQRFDGNSRCKTTRYEVGDGVPGVAARIPSSCNLDVQQTAKWLNAGLLLALTTTTTC